MGRPRTIDDQTLLPKAVRLFWFNGYAATGVRELEATLGLKAPSLYNRFGSKDALFRAALAHYIDTVVAQRVALYLEADDPLAGLRAFFDSSYNYLSEHAPPRGCLLVNTSLELSAPDPSMLAQLMRGNQMIRAGFRCALERAYAQGLLSREANIEALVDALQLGFQGLLVTSKVERDKAVLKKRTDALFTLLPITHKSRKGMKP